MQIPPPPFNTSLADKLGRMSPEWQRHALATQQTITLDTAPADARYLVATANSVLTAEVNLGALSAGYLKQTVAAGVAAPTTTATIPAMDLSGTLPDAVFPASLPAINGSAVTNLNASALASGTVPDARFPATLPASNGSNLTSLNATQLTSGTVPDARFPATLPALSGVNLSALNASALASGTVPDARFPATLPAASAVNLTALKGVNVTHAVVTVNAAASPYTVLSSDETLLVDAVAGAVTITLPAATSGRILTVKKVDASINTVQLTGTVDGTMNPTIGTQFQSRMIQADGSTWNILAGWL